MKILLVEDEKELRESLYESLQMFGHDVLSVDNGKAALDIVLSTDIEFDVIITDQNMPVMKGTELAQSLLDERCQADVICFSSDVDDVNFPRHLFTKCITKPNALELLSHVEGLK
jgi:CheY-like chemotaxis protein